MWVILGHTKYAYLVEHHKMNIEGIDVVRQWNKACCLNDSGVDNENFIFFRWRVYTENK